MYIHSSLNFERKSLYKILLSKTLHSLLSYFLLGFWFSCVNFNKNYFLLLQRLFNYIYDFYLITIWFPYKWEECFAGFFVFFFSFSLQFLFCIYDENECRALICFFISQHLVLVNSLMFVHSICSYNNIRWRSMFSKLCLFVKRLEENPTGTHWKIFLFLILNLFSLVCFFALIWN